jgi:hypothetical protein
MKIAMAGSASAVAIEQTGVITSSAAAWNLGGQDEQQEPSHGCRRVDGAVGDV